MSMLQGLIPSEDESFEKILLALLDTKGVVTKTEIQRPLNLARLKAFGNWCKSEGLTEPAEFVDEFIKIYLEYMISNKRQSRKEVIQALAEGIKAERSLGEKLTSKPS